MRDRVRPLLVRPGARFACAGDGLCCADAHLLGPVSPREARALRVEHPGATTREHRFVLLRTQAGGTCTFLSPAGRCAIHASGAKPRTCHRYPFLLTATPDGGRIGTDHRCPCRTMGARPPLRAEDAEPALRDAAGRLSTDHRAPPSIALAPRRRVGWSRWRELEGELLARLASGERVEDVLDAPSFPELAEGSWLQIGVDLALDEKETRWARANQWAGDAIVALVSGRAPSDLRPRPWADAFDRAEARTSHEQSQDDMLADWIADAIWTLEWTLRGDFALARADLATRVTLARWIAARLARTGLRPDRALAEAIAIAEILGLSDPWGDRFRLASSRIQ